jgi:hypothetical protein
MALGRALAACALLAIVLAAAPASADPVEGSHGTIVCNGTTYNVISPNHAVTGSDANSTSQLLLILDKDPTFSTDRLTLCTAYPPPPDEPFSADVLITPVHK